MMAAAMRTPGRADRAADPVRVIGVQSEAAPTAYRTWRERRLVEDRMETFAEGLATSTAFELPRAILWRRLLRDHLTGKRGASILSGGNVSREQLIDVLTPEHGMPHRL